MFDLIKVLIVMLGVVLVGGLMLVGILVSVVIVYFDVCGIVVEKMIDFMILFLFLIGIMKGKWGLFVSVLCDFKCDYDVNLLFDLVILLFVKEYGLCYVGMGLKDLVDMMFVVME